MRSCRKQPLAAQRCMIWHSMRAHGTRLRKRIMEQTHMFDAHLHAITIIPISTPTMRWVITCTCCRIKLARQTQWQRDATLREIKLMQALSFPFIVVCTCAGAEKLT